jgi:sulfonate transport system substrate-binding protein
MPFIRRFLSVPAVILLLASACARENSPQETANISSTSDALVVGFPDPANLGVFAYAKREGILERELAKANAHLQWVPAAGAFSANFDAMNSGVMNAAGGAVSPVIGALSHNLQFRIYAIANPGGTRRAGLISPRNSAIKRVADLVGKRVAVNWAAKGDYVLLKALEEANIPSNTVERVAIQPPEAAAAFATGKIDAWSTFGTFFSTAERNGANILVREIELASDDVGVLSASVGALEKNPAAFATILRVSRELTQLAHQYPERFVNVFTDKGPTALSGEELRLAIEETRVLPEFRVPTSVDRKRIENVSRLLYENKSIDRKLSSEQAVFDVGP